MSIECLNKALKIQFEGQTPTKRLILILLANYCDDQNSCYPSYTHIAKLAGLKDPKHIAKIVKEFESLGLLKIQRRFKDDGGNTSNRYFLTLRSTDTPPHGLETPTPPSPETPSLLVSTPPNTKEDTKDKTKDNTKAYNSDFKSFWSLYPRKDNKAKAEESYKSILKKFSHEQMIAYVESYNNDIEFQKKDKKFIPFCTTWLNQKRFLDYEDYEMQEIVKDSQSTVEGNWFDDLEVG
jgi:hypothetical protein